MKKKIFAFLFAFIFISLSSLIYLENLIQKKSYSNAEYFDTGLNTAVPISQEIEYSRYELYDKHLQRLCPNYTNSNFSNACAPVAGANIVGYYDYTCPNLIPDFETGQFNDNGYFYYNAQNASIQTLKSELYDLMGTNTVKPGTSVNQFKNGLKSYVNNKGYSINYYACRTILNSSFNLDKAIEYVNKGYPVAIFVNSYEYYPEAGIRNLGNKFVFSGRTSPNGHVVAAYGYREYKFFDENDNLFRTDKYLVVSFGDGTQGYLAVNNTSSIDSGLGIQIS